MIKLSLTLTAKDGQSWVIPLKVLVGKALKESFSSEPKRDIPDNGAAVTDEIVLSSMANVSEDFSIDVNITHPYIADLKVSLLSPSGKELILHNRTGYSENDIVGNYPQTLKPDESLEGFWGSKLDGIWTMKVRDLATGDSGTWGSWGIQYISGYECH